MHWIDSADEDTELHLYKAGGNKQHHNMKQNQTFNQSWVKQTSWKFITKIVHIGVQASDVTMELSAIQSYESYVLGVELAENRGMSQLGMILNMDWFSCTV